MNIQKLKEKATMAFQTPMGQIVDVLFLTSDGTAHLTHEEAKERSTKLTDKTITPFYKDSKIREIADKVNDLKLVMRATDYLKSHRALRKPPPVYEDYVSFCSKSSQDPIPEGIYKFVTSKVYASKRPVNIGEKDYILTWTDGIIEASFLRRYPHGQIYTYGDRLVFTCPTNTEIMSGTYKEIFSAVF